jgi:uroporphyrinogen-III synthase
MINVINTRPLFYQGRLRSDKKICFFDIPSILIEPNEKILKKFNYNKIILTSQIAVEYAKKNKILKKINGKFFAVGNSTRDYAKKYLKSVSSTSSVDGIDSLLESAFFLNSKNEEILIIQGKKNNKELSKKIQRLGAKIYFYEPYKRKFPDISYKKKLNEIIESINVDFMMVSSKQNLENIMTMTYKRNQKKILQIKIIPTHPNLVGYVLQQGFKDVYLNDGFKKIKENILLIHGK